MPVGVFQFKCSGLLHMQSLFHFFGDIYKFPSIFCFVMHEGRQRKLRHSIIFVSVISEKHVVDLAVPNAA